MVATRGVPCGASRRDERDRRARPADGALTPRVPHSVQQSLTLGASPGDTPSSCHAATGLREAWSGIKYTDAIYDEQTGRWLTGRGRRGPFAAFTSKKPEEQIPGRLVVRRIPDLNPKKNQGQTTLFDTWRFNAFFTTTPTAERVRCGGLDGQ